MRPTVILVCLSIVLGCGKEETTEPKGQVKAPPKPALPDSKKGKPKPTHKKETPQPKPEPKVDFTKHERFLWEFETEGAVVSSPALGADGTVYVGSGSGDSKVHALNGKSGAKKWEFGT